MSKQIQLNKTSKTKNKTTLPHARYVLFLVLIPANTTTNTEIVRTIMDNFRQDYNVHIESTVNHIGNRKMQVVKYDKYEVSGNVTNTNKKTKTNQVHIPKRQYNEGYYAQCYMNVKPDQDLSKAIFNCKKYLDNNKKVLSYYLTRVKHNQYFFDNIASVPEDLYFSHHKNTSA